MNTSPLEKRSIETALFNPGRIDPCVAEHRAHRLSLELRSAAELDRLDFQEIDGDTCASWSVEFANECEEEFARMLESQRILWRYKPRTFAVEWDEEGNFVDSFTPGFYLPEQNRFIEVAAPDCRVAAAARKIRLLRRQYSRIQVDLIFWPESSQTCLFAEHSVQTLDDEKADR